MAGPGAAFTVVADPSSRACVDPMNDPGHRPPPASRPSPSRAAAIAVVASAGAGLLAQRAFPPDGAISLVFGVTSAVIHGVVADALPPRLRSALASAEAFSVALGALAAACLLALLVVQRQTPAFYRAVWGRMGDAIVALRVDDTFRSLWFAGLVGVVAGTALLAAAPLARRRLRSRDQ